MNKIYVGNLPYNFSESDLENMFNEFGTISSVRLIKDYTTGRSKGFAFIELENSDQAKEAVSKMNGKELEGRRIKVSIAIDKRT